MQNYQIYDQEGDLIIILYNNHCHEVMRVLVDSERFCCSSTYFADAINDESDNEYDQHGNIIMRIYGWDPKAFVTLVHIFQGEKHLVPRRLHLEELVDVAWLMNLFEGHEAIKKFSDEWIIALIPEIGYTLHYETLQWLFIADTFDLTNIYFDMWQILYVQSPARVLPCGLPIRAEILDGIEEARLLSYYSQTPLECVEGCKCTITSDLRAQLNKVGLLSSVIASASGYQDKCEIQQVTAYGS